MTVTRSSGSGMRDLPCAGDGNSRPRFSRLGFRHQLLCAFATGQERRNKPEISAAKLYCLHLQEQERKSAAERGREEERERDSEREAERGAERERGRGREQRKRRRERDEETKKGSARTPSLLRRIILRLGRVIP